MGSSELGPIYRRTGHPSSYRPRHTDRFVGAAVRGRHSPPGSGGITTSALSAVQAHRGTEGLNPFPSSAESAANRFRHQWMPTASMNRRLQTGVAAATRSLGSPKDSTRPTSERQRRCSTHWREPPTGMCREPARMSAPWPARASVGVDQEWLLRVALSQYLEILRRPRTAFVMLGWTAPEGISRAIL